MCTLLTKPASKTVVEEKQTVLLVQGTLIPDFVIAREKLNFDNS
jgi:hypothetical protein